MTKANTLVIAKVVAFVAAAGLVVSVFGIQASAQTTTTTTTTTSASSCASFNRDLTVGSTGADVTALQNWLISKGFTIAAGATGYFGGQTQAALARYQASVGISPAAGYFGPITRAKVNSVACGTTTPGGNDDDDDDDDSDDDDDDNDGELSGGEADLSDFEFNRENSSGDEGETEVEIATANFDVEDGDVRVERFEVMASSTGTGTASDRPWDYFETMYLWVDGDEVADIDAGDRDNWDEEDDDVYRLSFTDLDYVVEEGEVAEITLVGDISDNLDAADISTGEFEFYVEDEGIRARDGEGIDHYIGDEDEVVVFGFGEEEDGELNIESSDEDPDSMTLIGEDDESDEYMVFAFEMDNQEDADVLVTDLNIDVNTISTTTTAEDLLSDATLTIDGEEYDGDIDGDVISFEDIDLEIAGDESVSAELTVTLRADAAEAGNVQLTFSVGTVEAEGVESGDDATVDGDATSDTHTIADEGIMVTAEEDDAEARNEAESSVSDTGVGTFRITFDVEAIEEDIYIYRGAAQGDNDATPFSGVASTTGVVYNVFQGSSASSTVVTTGSLSGTADQEGQFYVIEAGDTETFTLTVTVDTPVAGSYYAELDAVRFDTVNDGSTLDDELYTVPDESEFESETESLY